MQQPELGLLWKHKDAQAGNQGRGQEEGTEGDTWPGWQGCVTQGAAETLPSPAAGRGVLAAPGNEEMWDTG